LTRSLEIFFRAVLDVLGKKIFSASIKNKTPFRRPPRPHYNLVLGDKNVTIRYHFGKCLRKFCAISYQQQRLNSVEWRKESQNELEHSWKEANVDGFVIILAFAPSYRENPQTVSLSAVVPGWNQSG